MLGNLHTYGLPESRNGKHSDWLSGCAGLAFPCRKPAQVFSKLVSKCFVPTGTVLAAPHTRSRSATKAAAEPFGYDPRWLVHSPLHDGHLAAEAGAWYNATTEVDAFTGIPHAFMPRRVQYKPPGALLVFDLGLSRAAVEVRPGSVLMPLRTGPYSRAMRV